MAEEPNQASGRRNSMVTVRVILGLLVFLLGIALILFVFVQAYNLFESIDDEIAAVGKVADNPGPVGDGEPSGPTGPTLGQVALVIGLRIAILIALGFLSGLVATQGVRMIAAHGEKERA